MKRWTVIIGTAVVAAYLGVTVVRDFFANETVQYFSTEPVRLLYVVVLAIGGGLVALVFDHLSPRAKRCAKIFAWGATASVSTAFIGLLAFGLASLTPMVVESGAAIWVIVAMLLFASLASYLWLEFYRALNTRVSK
jgi:hypothetical protein